MTGSESPTPLRGQVGTIIGKLRREAVSLFGTRRQVTLTPEEAVALFRALDGVWGDVYLWRTGEIDAEKAMEGVRDSIEVAG